MVGWGDDLLVIGRKETVILSLLNNYRTFIIIKKSIDVGTDLGASGQLSDCEELSVNH